MSEQQYVMPITSEGQVMIPAAVRQLLGLKKSGKVAFKIKGGVVMVEPVQAKLQATYGAVTSLSRPEDFERISEIAQQEQALRATPSPPR